MQDQYPEIIIQLMVSILIGLLTVAFIVAFFQIYQKKKLVQEIQLENLKATFERELLQTRLEIQEEVLKKISMEIHDNIGQIMLLSNINISMLQTMELPIGAPELIIETKTLISKATEDLSQLSRNLNSDRITEIGVFAAIRHELTLLSQKKLFQVQLSGNYDQDGKDLPKETQLLVFRMFQEICNNIIKHAKATLVQVLIEKNETSIKLELKDNGIGFDLRSFEDEKSAFNGVGLRNLQSRVNLFKGNIEITSILLQGTTIGIFVPLK